MNQNECPRCHKDAGMERLLCDECYIDIRRLQRPLEREEPVVNTPTPDGPDVLKKVLHWMLGSRVPKDAGEVWAVAKYRNETTIAMAASIIFHRLTEQLAEDHIAMGIWVRSPDANKAEYLRRLPFDTGDAQAPNSPFNVLLRDWAITALVEWSNDHWVRHMYPPINPRED